MVIGLIFGCLCAYYKHNSNFNDYLHTYLSIEQDKQLLPLQTSLSQASTLVCQ